jgi:hypothetical protein
MLSLLATKKSVVLSRTAIREVVPELANRRLATQTYKKMARTDASVKVSLRAGKTPVLGGDYYIEAFDEQDLNQSIQEFVDFNIFPRNDYALARCLQNICHFIEDGFAVFEPVWELSASGHLRKQTPVRIVVSTRCFASLLFVLLLPLRNSCTMTMVDQLGVKQQCY